MEVLIAGGAGDVGGYLSRYLLDRGFGVKVYDLKDKMPEAWGKNLSGYFRGDLVDRKKVEEALKDVDIVINLAWSFAEDPYIIFERDIKGHLNLLETACKLGVKRFVYTSTATVYGRAVTHPVSEDHPCLLEEARKPLYALGKFTAEKLCLMYQRERGLPVTIFRFWWAFGDTIGGRHLRNLIHTALENKPLEMVPGAGGTFVTMLDLAEAIRLAVENPAAAGQVYNVGSLFLTWEEIGAMIIDLTGSNSTLNLIPSARWRGPTFLNEVWDLSWDKLARELGYRPQVKIPEMRAMFTKALKNCIAQVKTEEKPS
ncbi:UDP-glucose 4-epimerase [Thermanaeromonas toyohensis ToBE]|uniref:UDP-glucose 4-epimerase n=1 Tax=Thermanaeromonas toyohensis ToBE TaxID=698762 RepID=A0A1W1VZA8_9FIRM|nr:NAD(P)-dependent oxidoreductase [Thermanaeromonas toyohensis]SMB98676.1 UDP-glucose 4-epimerase [Thermanaeromonas toyohensis ToBE]